MRKINREEYEVLKGLDVKWEWIARDKNESLFAYSEKPPKDNHSRDWGFTGDEWHLIGEILFQFIQWEDEEPYNIAELIKEYEIETGMRYDFGKIKVVDIDTSKLATRNGYIYVNESEETEVKKDIEWLKEEITEILLTSKKDGTNYFYYRDLKEKIYNAIHQLDQPETLTPEWIDEHITDGHNVNLGDKVIYADELDGVLVPKQEEQSIKTETVEEILADFSRSLERLREVWRSIE